MRTIGKIAPLLLVAFVAVACEEDGPTSPSDGLQLAVDCDDPKFQDHPKCGGGEEPPEGNQYEAIDLQQTCRRCDGVAHDVSEPDAGTLYVVGWDDQPLGSPKVALVWTGTPADIGSVDPVVLEAPVEPFHYGGSLAAGINDDPPYTIVGEANGWYPSVPVVWRPEGGGWATGEVLALGGYDSGFTRDVNNDGMIAGRLFSESDTVAVVWASPDAEPVPLFTPGDKSAALGLNNEGDVVGAVSGTAALWKAEGHTYCDLHPAGASESVVWRIEDRVGGNVLIAGRVSGRPAVWTVDAASCDFTIETIAGVPVRQYSRALDVRRVEGGWEAVGTFDTRGDVQPVVWFDNGNSSELLHDKYGNALVINGDGHIVGNRQSKGLSRAVFWRRNQP
jgi:hypothetical protein